MSEESLQELIEIAKQARLHSIAPFSDFLVGAAVRTAAGNVYTGCNVESASYGLTVCGERVANRFCGTCPLLVRGIFEELRQWSQPA